MSQRHVAASIRLSELTLLAAKARNYAHVALGTRTKRHHAFRHQPDFAHLDVCGERHADEQAQEDRS